MLLLSAFAMMLGFSLHIFSKSNKSAGLKMILLMTIANFVSIVAYLLNLKPMTGMSWSVAIVFLNAIILILNLVIGFFVRQLFYKKNSLYYKQVLNLFILSFISSIILLSFAYIFKTEFNFFDISSKGFIYMFVCASGLFVFGSLIPVLKSSVTIFKKGNLFAKIDLLIILNFLNNLIGLYFYTFEFPNKDSSIVLNMLVNLAFAYYLAYFLLSEHFTNKHLVKEGESVINLNYYSWLELQKHLSHWSETKSYLMSSNPDLIEIVDSAKLSDLEKIHYTLRLLNLKAKDVAHAMNISTRAVEMQRYRISKKLSKSENV